MRLIVPTTLGLCASLVSGAGEVDIVDFNIEDYIDEATEVFNKLVGDANVGGYTLESFLQAAGSEGDANTKLVFKRDDANEDGIVDFVEFKRWFTRGNLFLQLDGALTSERDGLVSREEFMVEWHAMPEAVFVADDKDEDGFISFEEFTGPKGADGRDVNVFAALDDNRDGVITKEEFGAEWHQVSLSVFDTEDIDGDGVISWDEFKGPKGNSLEEALLAEKEYPTPPEGATNLFAALDTDMDGRISRKEFDVEWHQHPNSDIFETEDGDNDGFLSWAEFNGPKGTVDPKETLQKNLFLILDTDRDGSISTEEFGLNKLALGDEETEALFKEDDKNGDGLISWQEFSGPKGEAPPVYNVFAVFDVDGDGFVTHEEFMVEFNSLGNDEQFATEDKDGDGRISWEEFGGPKGTGPGDTGPQKEL
mmetsp:Transcript_11553/g.16710  ORF Transcript_11553/g.16710 Transcript_11553/m.16710 type:complete len:422 (-) Transcript_11553:42-1307(-)|eukprot:CAMPEP_0195523440 /NCGR_PEP_ID=MMETSP0794_2-20130614/22640_1 /TAXON_ID=515487 /ORGANISM="Stephanopyxis turris, Strain CCMP 815" /LENGTH=421 /DNA_ID=CAMNT_0040653445 /DNA_START=70 /DNA_END=1335 /DNA_ORIENTATION=+